MSTKARTYDLRFHGGGPEESVPEGGRFDSESDLLERIDEVHGGDYGPLALGDAEVAVFEGDGVDPLEGPVTVIGKADAATVRQNRGVPEDAIWE